MSQGDGLARDIPNLSQLGAISAGFEFYQKLVTPGVDVSLPIAYLKWYDIRRPEIDMPRKLSEESREFLRAEVETDRLRIANQLGFVELHHCSSVAFLLVFTWNNDNELWLTVYIKDLVNDGAFQLFDVRDSYHRTICCVWELAPVWHERQAWLRYLRSAHDEEAKRAYLADRFVGLC